MHIYVMINKWQHEFQPIVLTLKPELKSRVRTGLFYSNSTLHITQAQLYEYCLSLQICRGCEYSGLFCIKSCITHA